MAQTTHGALRIVLRVFSIFLALASVIAIFSSRPMVLRLFLRPPETEVSTLLLALLKEFGGVMLMLSVLLWLASRDPVRNVAILDALMVGLFALAVTPLISLWTTDIGKLYSAYLIWGRALVRLALAALLYFFRPQETYSGARSESV